MSVGPLGGLGAAGAPLAQTSGSEVERARQDAAAQQRQIQTGQKADAAAGIGETDGQDHETEERDADGRRPWEIPAGETNQSDDASAAPDARRGKDASGQRGNLLDLSG
ncbi:MAG: hypothetical protein JW809_00455 [Pirellulales bacterium]|nr:hypothetical protein [Pirellulales bacterium]